MRRALLLLAVLVLAAAAAWWLLGTPAGRDGDGDEIARDGSAKQIPEAARLAGRAASPESSAAPAPAANDAADATGDVLVRATRYGTGGTLAGARVAAVDAAGRRHEGVTDAEGQVTLSDLAPGTARVEAAWPGWVAETTEAEVTAGGTAQAALYLMPAARARGRVLTAAHGTPVAGALVIAAAEGTVGTVEDTVSGDVWGVVRTDAEGRFSLPAVPADEISTITVLATGYARLLRNLTFRADHSDNELVLRLEPGGTLRGMVVDRAGNGVRGAAVYAWPDGDEYLREVPTGAWTDGEGRLTVAGWSARADAEGRFELCALTLDARYAATAFDAAGVRAIDVTGMVPTEATPTVEVRLVTPDPATLEVRVLDAEGAPVSGCRVGRTRAWGAFGFASPQGETDAAGRVVLRPLAPGAVDVRAEARGWLSERREVEVQEGATQQVEIRLRRGVTIAGLAVDGQGRPIENLRVHTSRTTAGETVDVTTDADGRFRLEGLAPGEHVLRAEGGGWVLVPAVTAQAPAADVRLECVRRTSVKGRLVLPPGTPAPERLMVGSVHESGAGGWSYTPWDDGRIDVDVGEGTSRLDVQGDGFAPLHREIRVDPGETLDLGDIALPAGVSCGGVVADAAGAPVRGAVVKAAEHEWRETRTDAAGRFLLEHLDPQDLRLEVQAEGFLPCSVDVGEGATRDDLRVVLARGGSLELRLLDAAGLALVGAEILVEPADLREEDDEDAFFERSGWGETDAQGRVALRLPPGSYTIQATRGEQPLATGRATLTEGKTTEVELRAAGER